MKTLFLTIILVSVSGCTTVKSTWPLADESPSRARASLTSAQSITVSTAPAKAWDEQNGNPLSSRGQRKLRNLSAALEFMQIDKLFVDGLKNTEIGKKQITDYSEKIEEAEKRLNIKLAFSDPKSTEYALTSFAKGRVEALGMRPGDARIAFSYGYSPDLGSAGVRAKVLYLADETNEFTLCTNEFESQVVVFTPEERRQSLKRRSEQILFYSKLHDALKLATSELLSLLSRHLTNNDVFNKSFKNTTSHRIRVGSLARYHSFDGSEKENLNFIEEGNEHLHFYAKNDSNQERCGTQYFVAQTSHNYRAVMSEKYAQKMLEDHPKLNDSNRKFYYEQTLKNQQILIDSTQ